MNIRLFRVRVFSLLVATTLSVAVGFAVPQVGAQGDSQPQVSVVNLQAIHNSDGTTSVITPKGDLAPLPGAGVSGDVAQIYVGSSGGFWYQDQSGNTVDLHDAVQQLMARRSQAQRASQVPQYAPAPYPEQQQQQSSGGSNTASTALMVGAAAGLGSMAGAAISHSYYDMPYGTPMYYGAGGRAYYYNNGERQELTPNQQAFAYNKYAQNQNQQQQQQEAIQNAQSNSQNRYNERQSNSQERYNQRQSNVQDRQQTFQQNRSGQESRFGNSQLAHNNFQQQQQWYQQQLQNKDTAGRWSQQSHNPFVNDQHSGGRSGILSNRSGSSESRQSRFQGRENRGGGFQGLGNRGGGRSRGGGRFGR